MEVALGTSPVEKQQASAEQQALGKVEGTAASRSSMMLLDSVRRLHWLERTQAIHGFPSEMQRQLVLSEHWKLAVVLRQQLLGLVHAPAQQQLRRFPWTQSLPEEIYCRPPRNQLFAREFLEGQLSASQLQLRANLAAQR